MTQMLSNEFSRTKFLKGGGAMVVQISWAPGQVAGRNALHPVLRGAHVEVEQLRTVGAGRGRCRKLARRRRFHRATDQGRLPG